MQRLKNYWLIKILKLSFFFLPVHVSGQIHYDFEDQDLSGWFMQADSAWSVVSSSPVSGSYSLKHVRDNPLSGSDMIGLCIDSLQPDQGTVTWQFTLKHGYDPSQANRWAVLLLSDMTYDTEFVQNNLNGIAVTINHNNSDDMVRVIRFSEGETMEIINTGFNWQELAGISQPVYFQVERSRSGNWTVNVQIQTALPAFTYQSSGYDPWLPDIQSFLIYYTYSSRQDQKLWVDDIHIDGVFMKDIVAPCIRKVEVLSKNELLVTFSERIDYEHIVATVVSPTAVQQVADSIVLCGDSSLYISFLNDFPSGSVSNIILENVYDRKGNRSSTLQQDFFYRRTERYDILINEIMYDPEPAHGLPEYEYVELYNRSEYEISTDGWILVTEEKSWPLGHWHIPPERYLLLTCREAVSLFGNEENIKVFFTSSASLPNQGCSLRLIDQYGDIISFVLYDPSWHTEIFKKDGGWSLERIDPGNPCGGSDNWRSSISLPGGTPCFVNSVRADNPDNKNPVIGNIYCPDDRSLEVEFSETMDPGELDKISHYSINHGTGSPDSVMITKADFSYVRLCYNLPVFRKRLIYELTVDDKLTDCCGNVIQSMGDELFARAEPVAIRDILISEILFNPLPGGVDFLELYNNSEKVFDLNDLWLGTRDGESNQLDITGKASGKHHLFYPGEYIVLTADPDIIRSMYFVRDLSCLIQTSLPSLGNEEGTIIILNQWLEVIDELTYSEDMHFGLLDSQEGISLERISFKETINNPYNWYSAAETAGFGTPGYENSQFEKQIESDQEIHIEPEVFTPDNDGQDDQLYLSWSFDKPGKVISIRIFDPRGQRVRTLANNMLAAPAGLISWDGITDDQAMARSGMYLILIEVFDEKGSKGMYRETCVLGRKFR